MGRQSEEGSGRETWERESERKDGRRKAEDLGCLVCKSSVLRALNAL
jgi:hypothetical protein